MFSTSTFSSVLSEDHQGVELVEDYQGSPSFKHHHQDWTQDDSLLAAFSLFPDFKPMLQTTAEDIRGQQLDLPHGKF